MVLRNSFDSTQFQRPVVNEVLILIFEEATTLCQERGRVESNRRHKPYLDRSE
jgi:hypothetical protein